MEISFGKKIPVTKYKILDTYREEQRDVTLFELDCKDEEDILLVKSAVNLEAFKKHVLTQMQNKKLYYDSIRKFPPDIAAKYMTDEPERSFYVLQDDKDKDIIGLCQARNSLTGLTVEYIQTDKGLPYKYMGQGMLASFAKQVLKKGGSTLEVAGPLEDKKKFYNKCGFRETPPFNRLRMERFGMAYLVNLTEEKTGAPIIDLNA